MLQAALLTEADRTNIAATVTLDALVEFIRPLSEALLLFIFFEFFNRRIII
jgi:hypothetical protein